MIIFVKFLTGNCISVDIDPSDFVEQLKYRISDQIEKDSIELKLIFAGKSLEDGRRLCDYNIAKESTIHCLFRLRGGRSF